MFVEVVLFDASLHVIEDLGLFAKEARPIGIGFKGVGVEVRGNIASASRIGIVAPRPADGLLGFEDEKVVDT